VTAVTSGALPLVEASGTPHELGVAHGRAAASAIESLYWWRMGAILSRTGESEADVLARSTLYLGSTEQQVPHLLEEVQGIAAGSGLGFERTFFLQVATDVDRRSGKDGCSAVGIATDADGPMIAQNWDQPPVSRGKQIMLRLRPTGGPEILMFTHAGIVGYIGMNAAGVGHVQNQLYRSADAAYGLSQYFIHRRLLEFDTTEDAVDWLQSIPIGSTANYVIGDRSGNIVDLELGDGRAVAVSHGPTIAHTNHYTHAAFMSGDDYRIALPDSSQRLDTLRTNYGQMLDRADLYRSLADHANYPISICRHEDDGLQTVASIVLWLGQRRMEVSYGNPCRTPYMSYPMGD
jgi:isopenicillin-N N-acyltransferase-like protein